MIHRRRGRSHSHGQRLLPASKRGRRGQALQSSFRAGASYPSFLLVLRPFSYSQAREDGPGRARSPGPSGPPLLDRGPASKCLRACFAELKVEVFRYALAHEKDLRHRASAPSRYAASGGPNQVVSASASPSWVWSPTQATYPSGRINTAVGAVTAPSAGSSHGPPYSASID